MKHVKATINDQVVRGIEVRDGGGRYLLHKHSMASGMQPDELYGMPHARHMDETELCTPIYGGTEKHRLSAGRVLLLRRLSAVAPELAKRVALLGDEFLAPSQEEAAKVSYASEKRFKYDSGRRVRTSFQRYVRRRLGVSEAEMPPQALDEVAYDVVGGRPCDIKFLSGEELLTAYRLRVGSSSCMTGESAQQYVAVYARNPDKVRLAVLSDKARALLWTTDEGVQVLDRIYPPDGAHVAAFHRWASERGIVYRVSQAPPYKGTEISDGGRYCVTLRHEGLMPYMDTFHYGTGDESVVTCSNDPEFGDLCFDSTSGGGLRRLGRQRCISCGERVPEEDTVEIEEDIYCQDCVWEVAFRCDRCDGLYYRAEETRIGGSDSDTYWCSCCVTRGAEQCESCGDWFDIYSNELVRVDGDALCDSCYDERGAVTCDQCGDHSTEYVVINFRSGRTEVWCMDCAEETELCSECDERWAELKETKDGQKVCDDCGQTCGVCGEWFPKNDLKEGMCDDCKEVSGEENDGTGEHSAAGETLPTDDGGDHGGGENIREQDGAEVLVCGSESEDSGSGAL